MNLDEEGRNSTGHHHHCTHAGERPDRTFRYFKSVYHRNFCSSEAPIDGFRGAKIAKCSVGERLPKEVLRMSTQSRDC